MNQPSRVCLNDPTIDGGEISSDKTTNPPEMSKLQSRLSRSAVVSDSPQPKKKKDLTDLKLSASHGIECIKKETGDVNSKLNNDKSSLVSRIQLQVAATASALKKSSSKRSLVGGENKSKSSTNRKSTRRTPRRRASERSPRPATRTEDLNRSRTEELQRSRPGRSLSAPRTRRDRKRSVSRNRREPRRRGETRKVTISESEPGYRVRRGENPNNRSMSESDPGQKKGDMNRSDNGSSPPIRRTRTAVERRTKVASGLDASGQASDNGSSPPIRRTRTAVERRTKVASGLDASQSSDNGSSPPIRRTRTAVERRTKVVSGLDASGHSSENGSSPAIRRTRTVERRTKTVSGLDASGHSSHSSRSRQSRRRQMGERLIASATSAAPKILDSETFDEPDEAAQKETPETVREEISSERSKVVSGLDAPSHPRHSRSRQTRRQQMRERFTASTTSNGPDIPDLKAFDEPGKVIQEEESSETAQEDSSEGAPEETSKATQEENTEASQEFSKKKNIGKKAGKKALKMLKKTVAVAGKRTLKKEIENSKNTPNSSGALTA